MKLYGIVTVLAIVNAISGKVRQNALYIILLCLTRLQTISQLIILWFKLTEYLVTIYITVANMMLK